MVNVLKDENLTCICYLAGLSGTAETAEFERSVDELLFVKYSHLFELSYF